MRYLLDRIYRVASNHDPFLTNQPADVRGGDLLHLRLGEQLELARLAVLLCSGGAAAVSRRRLLR